MQGETLAETAVKLSWQVAQIDDLSSRGLLELLRARQQVFVLEQKCLYADIDALDPDAWHVCGRDDHNVLLAYARILGPGDRYCEPSFGRVLTTADARGSGVGRQLVQQCIDWCQHQFPQQTIRISAQTYLRRFYQSFAFTVDSAPYDEDGIEHVDMCLLPQAICNFESN